MVAIIKSLQAIYSQKLVFTNSFAASNVPSARPPSAAAKGRAHAARRPRRFLLLIFVLAPCSWFWPSLRPPWPPGRIGRGLGFSGSVWRVGAPAAAAAVPRLRKRHEAGRYVFLGRVFVPASCHLLHRGYVGLSVFG